MHWLRKYRLYILLICTLLALGQLFIPRQTRTQYTAKQFGRSGARCLALMPECGYCVPGDSGADANFLKYCKEERVVVKRGLPFSSEERFSRVLIINAVIFITPALLIFLATSEDRLKKRSLKL